MLAWTSVCQGLVDSGSNSSGPHHRAHNEADRQTDAHVNDAQDTGVQCRAEQDAVENDDKDSERCLSNSEAKSPQG